MAFNKTYMSVTTMSRAKYFQLKKETVTLQTLVKLEFCLKRKRIRVKVDNFRDLLTSFDVCRLT